ncbi:hypothetical protein ACIQW9_01150 [Herminiimonas sp. NPDC097707]|uniref:hypothetical protein n=1 Tax=Herminiimonas sp. NPDC097707 TaxID=3364007 RepID=UPI00383BF48A
MNGLIPHKLTVGTRIAIKNQAFEVSFVDAVNVRYASCVGGRIHTMPTTTFWECVDTGVIGFLDKSENLPSLDNEYGIPYLSDIEQEQMLLRFKFVQEAMRCTQHIQSKENLERTISKVCLSGEIAIRPGKSTLARWIKHFISSGCEITSLVPRHADKGSRQNRLSIDIEHLVGIAIRDDFLTAERPTVQQVHANVIGRALENGIDTTKDKLLSARTMHRRVKALDPYIQALKRHGKRYADLRFRAAGTSMETSRLMEIVMMDGHRMDIIVVDPETGEVLGRPYLVCLFDVHTRAVVGWHISLIPFCATTALAAIKDMCSRDPLSGPGGVPEIIITDNGPDLISYALRQLLARIGIHIQSSKTYCPDDKAFIERFFRTLCMQLIHMIKGTTFSSPTDRGDYDSSANAVVTLENLCALFKQWLDDNYHKSIHSVTNRAPALAWRDKQAEMPILSYAREDLDAIARISYMRKINNGRVIVDNLAYKSDALATLEMRDQRNVTVKVDEMNLGYVYVSPVSNPKQLIRADCVRINYSNNLTKYEHDQVQKSLADMAQKDRDELGAYAYEIARWRLWNSIHNLSNSKSSRQLKLLTEGLGSKAAARKKVSSMRLSTKDTEIADSSITYTQAPDPMVNSHSASQNKSENSHEAEFEVGEL